MSSWNIFSINIIFRRMVVQFGYSMSKFHVLAAWFPNVWCCDLNVAFLLILKLFYSLTIYVYVYKTYWWQLWLYPFFMFLVLAKCFLLPTKDSQAFCYCCCLLLLLFCNPLTLNKIPLMGMGLSFSTCTWIPHKWLHHWRQWLPLPP